MEDDEAACVSVFLNPELLGDDRAEEFAWQHGEDSIGRQLNRASQEQFFERMAKPDSGIKILGVNEFPYTDGNRLRGRDRMLEREYWIVDPTQQEYVLLHVHFGGQWHDDQHRRDRSTVMQANLRHSVTTQKPNQRVFFRKCKDMSAWREEFGKRVCIAVSPWRWAERPDVHLPMYQLLRMGEECTKHVRTFSVHLPPASKARGHAFIIAVGGFHSETIPALPNVYNDASKLCESLER